MGKPSGQYRVEGDTVTIAQIVARTGIPKGSVQHAMRREAAKGPLTWAGLKSRVAKREAA